MLGAESGGEDLLTAEALRRGVDQELK